MSCGFSPPKPSWDYTAEDWQKRADWAENAYHLLPIYMQVAAKSLDDALHYVSQRMPDFQMNYSVAADVHMRIFSAKFTKPILASSEIRGNDQTRPGLVIIAAYCRAMSQIINLKGT